MADTGMRSRFVFWNKTRFFIVLVSLLCMTLAQINTMTFTFTVICMEDVVEGSNSTGTHWIESPTDKSFLFSAVAIGAITGLILSVPLIDHFGLRLVLTVYGLISSVASLFFPLAVSFNYFTVVLCRVLHGLAASILFTAV